MLNLSCEACSFVMSQRRCVAASAVDCNSLTLATRLNNFDCITLLLYKLNISSCQSSDMSPFDKWRIEQCRLESSNREMIVIVTIYFMYCLYL